MSNLFNHKTQKNLQQKLKEALENKDQGRVDLINHLSKEIEKLLLLKKLRENQKLLEVFKNDVLNVEKDGSYHIVEMILMKEIELLEIGDLEAIQMLEKLKNNAQKKIDELSKIALKFHQNQMQIEQENTITRVQNAQAPKAQYKPMTVYDGFHLEKTLGGEYIQVLDAEIKNLVTTDIVNSKPEQLSRLIIDEIKNIKKGNEKSYDSENSVSIKKDEKPPIDRKIKGEWTEMVGQQEKSKSQDLSNSNLQQTK